MIWLGILKYGYRETAEQIRQGILELVANHGFRKYYDPLTGEGLGENHSHGLPLFIDMIKNKGTSPRGLINFEGIPGNLNKKEGLSRHVT